jgi:leukotriene-A4 hydrolase
MDSTLLTLYSRLPKSAHNYRIKKDTPKAASFFGMASAEKSVEKVLRDPCTLSNLDEISFTHLSLALEVDFDASVLRGVATWRLKLIQSSSRVTLDTRGLSVTRATVLGADAPFSLGAEHAAFGTPLTVKLPEKCEPGRELVLSITYQTSPQSSALGWLPPEQTAGKSHPYVFSQCQAVHARALVPCADAPAAKFTYDAELTVPSWATALMSAVRSGSASAASGGQTTFKFTQAVPIPSYLLALAVGQLESREVGPRSSVWAEPSVVEAAAFEFAETEQFLAAAEAKCSRGRLV